MSWGGEGGETEGSSGTFWTIIDRGSGPGLGKCTSPVSETLDAHLEASWQEEGNSNFKTGYMVREMGWKFIYKEEKLSPYL